MKFLFLKWGLVFFSALLDSYVAFIVKHKFNELGQIDYSSFKNFITYFMKFFTSPLLITAVIAFFLAPALWFFALNKLDLSLAYPVLVGFHLFLVLLFGVGFLGETMSTNKMIGTGLIVLSLYFFYR